MKKNQRWTEGTIVRINLPDGSYSYAQLMPNYLVGFYEYNSKLKDFDLAEVASKPFLFFSTVYADAVTSGKWEKVAKIRDKFPVELMPMQFIQDGINTADFSLYNTYSGEILRSTKEQCRGLERAAVWEANHIEERLLDFFNGVSNQLSEKLNKV